MGAQTKRMQKSLIALMALSAAATVNAQEVGRWYVAPQIGAFVADGDRNLSDDSAFLLAFSIGNHVNESWSVEFSVNGANAAGYSPYAASVDALRVFRRKQKLSPYLTIGAGAMRNDFDAFRDSTDVILQGGAGLIWRLGSRGAFSVRPEVKARWDDAGRDRFLDYMGTLGFAFSFGAARPAHTPKQESPQPP